MRLSIHALELLVALRLLGAFALGVALLGLELLVGLLDLGDGLLADDADLAKDLRAEVGLLDEEVGEAEEVGEEGEDVVVFPVTGGEAVAEEDALAGGRLVEAVKLGVRDQLGTRFLMKNVYAANNS